MSEIITNPRVFVVPVEGQSYVARLGRDGLTELLGGFPTTIGLEIHMPDRRAVLGFWAKAGDGRESWSDEIDTYHPDTSLPVNERVTEAFFPERSSVLYGPVVITSSTAHRLAEGTGNVIDLTPKDLSLILDELGEGPSHAPDDGSHRRWPMRDIL